MKSQANGDWILPLIAFAVVVVIGLVNHWATLPVVIAAIAAGAVTLGIIVLAGRLRSR
ncbi:hypothetical protein [Isoptericola sp. NPDC057191]|uniref:hypothetical protein n=1 Tax=Isoptericola sp. NPDC057191 TaxID=3346041 RepID=UPI00363CB4F3